MRAAAAILPSAWLLAALGPEPAAAFLPPTHPSPLPSVARVDPNHEDAVAVVDRVRAAVRTTPLRGAGRSDVEATRESFLSDLLSRGLVGSGAGAAAALLSWTPSIARASGGATAGGAYLLSAKQRYNARVVAGIKAFLALDAEDLGQVNAFFESEEEGGWRDLSAAGYLLANAFRTSSTKPPDSLPSVKKWKSFAKDVELLKRAAAKNDGGKASAAYEGATGGKLDAYLDAVELPPGREL